MSSSGSRQNNFNLLRFVFASLVIVSHCPELLDGNRHREPLTQLFHTMSSGEVGVNGFFLLSGYLIVNSWVRRPQAWSYLSSRVLRILPGFAVATLACALVFAPIGGGPGYFKALNWPELTLGIAKLSLPKVPPVFPEQVFVDVGINGSLWTIRWEFVCYLLVLALGLLGTLKKGWVWASLTALLAVVYVAGQITEHPLLSRPEFRLVVFFGVGGCFYLHGQALLHLRRWPWLAGALALCLLPFQATAVLGMLTLGAWAILAFAVQTMRPLQGFNRLPDVSYGVYLYAWPLTKVLIHVWPTVGVPALTLITLAGSIACGTLSWYLVEKPALRLKAA
jgi:peptidoglycan/LPS O-acetylase OafA/YrhL